MDRQLHLWGAADDVPRDLYVRGEHRDVILQMTVLRRQETETLAAEILRVGEQRETSA